MAALLNCTFDQLRQRERQRTKRRIQFVSAIIAICVFLVAAIRYGLNRLSLERTSIGTYDLLVKPGINFLKPLLGSDQTSIEVSYKFFHLSPRGQAPFAGGSSLLFPALDQRRLFEWLNVYYLEESRQSPNKKADICRPDHFSS
jgi:hypothetical protein